MSSIGKLTASILSATNENTLALANLNFDFSLVKFDAPPEFNGLGAALTTTRRKNAESGSAHKTARRLGALFEQLVPPTPRLVKTYGLRVSEIAETPGVSPAGTAKDGPFQAFLGADGTSIWAAATSGGFNFGIHAPIAVHLLACMLARAWEAKVATSIWAELVKERQKEIDDDSCTNATSASGLLAAQQEITREQLALWDASARAWLRSADEAKFREQKKLVLITKNIGLPVAGGQTTYQKVINAWKQAMVGFENIIGGMPLLISDGTILLALSSWHLYPNLIIIGGQVKDAQFKDRLLPSSAVVTIGLSHKDEDDQAIRWSLTLSHLYHYGEPVAVTSTGGNTRVTIQQLHVVALGGLFRAWGLPLSESTNVASWMLGLWDALDDGQSHRLQNNKADLPWLYGLVIASRSLLRIQNEDTELCTMLLNYGGRRGKDFLGPANWPCPLFGLLSPCLLSALKEPDIRECGIQYMRELSSSACLLGDDAVICVVWRKGATTWHLYTTAIPHRRMSQKRLQDGSKKIEHVHARWILPEFDDLNNQTICNCIACDSTCSCSLVNGLCGPRCHPDGQRICHKYSAESDTEAEKATARGEEFLSADAFMIRKTLPQVEQSIFKISPAGPSATHLIWINPPRIYHNDMELGSCPETCPSIGAQGSCTCFESCFQPCRYIHQAYFDVIIETPHSNFSMFIRNKHKAGSQREPSAPCNIRPSIENARKCAISVKLSLEIFNTSSLNIDQLNFYLKYLASSGHKLIPLEMQPRAEFGFLLGGSNIITPQHLKALRGLLLATQLYNTLDGATIPLSILSKSLDSGLWIPPEMNSLPEFAVGIQKPLPRVPHNGSDLSTSSELYNDTSSTSEESESGAEDEKGLTREQTWSCIAMFEADIRVDPEGLQPVIAMAWENSIFVTNLLLSDPSDTNGTHRIKRIIGNVGRAGLTMMIAPDKPQIRAPSNCFSLVNHQEYDGKREDNFEKTSLHLSFTQWNVPLVSVTPNDRGVIDQDVFFLESVVSVHDQGVWVADLDVLKLLDRDTLTGRSYEIFSKKCDCYREDSDSEGENAITRAAQYISVDTWNELLDPPDSIAVFRARGNWVARLAAVSILRQKANGNTIVLGESQVCWDCFENEFDFEVLEHPLYMVVID
jgi:hypothetical protein